MFSLSFQVEKETFSTLLCAAKILHFYKTNFPKTFSELKVQVMYNPVALNRVGGRDTLDCLEVAPIPPNSKFPCQRAKFIVKAPNKYPPKEYQLKT